MNNSLIFYFIFMMLIICNYYAYTFICRNALENDQSNQCEIVIVRIAVHAYISIRTMETLKALLMNVTLKWINQNDGT